MSVTKIIAIVVAVLVIAGGAYFLGTSSNDNKGTSTTTEQKAPAKKELNLNEVLTKVKEKYPTVKETKVYTEANDPNSQLGKPNSYQQGAAFRDERTAERYSITDERWGTDAGGSIEVYASADDAKKRVEYLKAFQSQGNSLLNPGAFEQVNKVVIRVSNYLPKSQQDEFISFIKGQL